MSWIEMLRIALEVIGGFAVVAFVVLLVVALVQSRDTDKEDEHASYF